MVARSRYRDRVSIHSIMVVGVGVERSSSWSSCLFFRFGGNSYSTSERSSFFSVSSTGGYYGTVATLCRTFSELALLSPRKAPDENIKVDS
jgi:hypothetical protein